MVLRHTHCKCTDTCNRAHVSKWNFPIAANGATNYKCSTACPAQGKLPIKGPEKLQTVRHGAYECWGWGGGIQGWLMDSINANRNCCAPPSFGPMVRSAFYLWSEIGDRFYLPADFPQLYVAPRAEALLSDYWATLNLWDLIWHGPRFYRIF